MRLSPGAMILGHSFAAVDGFFSAVISALPLRRVSGRTREVLRDRDRTGNVAESGLWEVG